MRSGDMVNVLVYSIIVSEFELLSNYYIHYHKYIIGYAMNPLIQLVLFK